MPAPTSSGRVDGRDPDLNTQDPRPNVQGPTPNTQHQRLTLSSVLGLYIHVPFCAAICNYCNFNRGLFDAGLKDRYVAALLAELASKLARDQARSHALLDEIADLNREKLELEVAPELQEIAGLAA